MIKIKHGDLGNQEFGAALRKLDTYTGFDPRIAYRVGRITTAVKTESQKSSFEWEKIARKHAKLNEQGRLVLEGPANNQRIVFPTKEAEDQFNEEILPLLKREAEIKVHKIPIADLAGVGLTPSEITAIEHLIELDDKPLRLVSAEKGAEHGQEEKGREEA